MYETIAIVAAWLLIHLALSHKTQIDSWCEANPRVAGTLKILRGVGIDPWLVLQGVSLLVQGRLPKYLKPKDGGNSA